jgi:hypothetical protein
MTDLTAIEEPARDTSMSDESAAAGWMELLWRPWGELSSAVRSVVATLLPTTDVAASGDALEDDVLGRLAQAEASLRRELDAVRATVAACERRLLALEAQAGEGVPSPDDVPRVSPRSSRAMTAALSRAGELAAERGLTNGTDAAIVFGDRAEMGRPMPPRTKKASRARHRRA